MQDSLRRRNFFRMPFPTEAICFFNDHGGLIKGIVRDISIKGIYIVIEDCPQVSGNCEVQIIIDGLHSRLDITRISGRFTRCDDDGVAVIFDHNLEWIALVAVYTSKLQEQQSLELESLYRRS